jgi:hypothetical protein
VASGTTRRDESPGLAQHAFDLFLPEPDGKSPAALASGLATATPALNFPDREFGEPSVRALDAQEPDVRLPLGGIAPTDREVASARARMVGWAAACGIAVFAFLAQGPSLSPRESQAARPAVAAPSVDKPQSRGDITLSANGAGLDAPEAKTGRQAARPPGAKRTPPPVSADGQPPSGR